MKSQKLMFNRVTQICVKGFTYDITTGGLNLMVNSNE